MKSFEFANNADQDEVAHYEPPPLALYCLPSELRFFDMKKLERKNFWRKILKKKGKRKETIKSRN